jgi:hypothetical protein
VGGEPERPGLIVLADGAHAAFAAGAVAALARSGARWRVAAGAGLGAHLAALAALGETEEVERRWRRQSELGCPLLRPRIRAWRQRLGAAEGALVVPDVLVLGGWLDPEELDEFLAPEAAGLPERLHRAAARAFAAVHDLDLGESRWVAIESVGAPEALGALTAAACFPAGWPPLAAHSEGSSGPLWGGVAAMPAGGVPAAAEIARWDVVCGFPVPASRRSASGPSLFELVQRRDLDGGAERVQEWRREMGGAARVVAPTAEAWMRFASRDGADLGLEYPLPWEQNGELTAMVLSFGRFVAAEALVSSGA